MGVVFPSRIGAHFVCRDCLNWSAFGGKADMLDSPDLAEAAMPTFAVDLPQVQELDWDERVIPAGGRLGG